MAKQEENVIELTKSAYKELLEELENRKEFLRKEIADEISTARELGDLSENHAYTVAMEKKDMNENRISELEDIISRAKIIKEKKRDVLVGLGEKVKITNLDTKVSKIVVLVGSEETKSANPLEGQISKNSPLGEALFNSKIGEIVEVNSPSGKIRYKIDSFVRD